MSVRLRLKLPVITMFVWNGWLTYLMPGVGVSLWKQHWNPYLSTASIRIWISSSTPPQRLKGTLRSLSLWTVNSSSDGSFFLLCWIVFLSLLLYTVIIWFWVKLDDPTITRKKGRWDRCRRCFTGKLVANQNSREIYVIPVLQMSANQSRLGFPFSIALMLVRSSKNGEMLQ